MDTFLDLIGSEQFLQFLGTFGLAVLLVIYFIFFRDPKRDKFWQEKYDQLLDNYSDLHGDYTRLESRLDPESRAMSADQAIKLCHLALDRDLYKLYYLCCEKLDGRRAGDVNVFIQESINDTNEAWSKFTSPFPHILRITELYGMYLNGGSELESELVEIMQPGETPDGNEQVKEEIWGKLLQTTISMKREFNDNLRKLEQKIPVEAYIEPSV